MPRIASSEDPSPVLPLDLEREILGTAAELYPETIPNLLLVAHRVQDWIERLKYKTVTSSGVGSSCPFRALRQAIRSNLKPPDFFHHRVRHLFLGLGTTTIAGELEGTLSICRGIQSLVLFAFAGPSILPSLGAMQLRRLSIDLKALFGTRPIDTGHLAFTFVTHLDIFGDTTGQPDLLANLARLPALTHLALFRYHTAILETELSKNKKLQVLIHMQSVGYADDHWISIDDTRFVYMMLSDDEYERDWVVGVKGGMDFWARAALFVAKKRRGEIKPSSRCWIEDGDGI
ncbi:hypothetical protein B0H17DRAFT_1202419 [Mycena rosella]|uniref:Uncharacterized protein n=1 Tax=Mycena rosella TaxID=1033263 RepID=A0AAD7GDB0_MYCRO|nr:hypothetical protein B0H17DRAFT_1202419 [Mycena rosella]